MQRTLWVVVLCLVCGCASKPSTVSLDGKANYRNVFAGMTSPPPTVVNSRVEQEKKSVLGIIPLRSEYLGLWEFELLAPRDWVDEVKRGAPTPYGSIPYSEIDFSEVQSRELPEWFRPTRDEFTAWKMQGGLSYPRAHLFMEKQPESEQKIRVFIRRF